MLGHAENLIITLEIGGVDVDTETIIHIYENNPFVGIDMRTYYVDKEIHTVVRECFDYARIERFIEKEISKSRIPERVKVPLSEMVTIIALVLEAIS